jgi:hypothetical protein
MDKRRWKKRRGKVNIKKEENKTEKMYKNKKEWENKKKRKKKIMLTEGRKKDKRKNKSTKRNYAIHISVSLSKRSFLKEKSYVFRMNCISRVKNYLLPNLSTLYFRRFKKFSFFTPSKIQSATFT